ncbi:hypothetical protein [Sphingomonas sp. Y38-1Y]|uniref:hypothetical protein n=1 Tax=Sphingomonas sp. Y38-1Y TaxID=3078265 RepID=UPI0028EBA227|nr:hypothetical protein [Sphingomonas sp. Y38-1Y]
MTRLAGISPSLETDVIPFAALVLTLAPPQDGALKKAGDIASQPARDVGVGKREIPLVLQNATEAPYRQDTAETCPAIATEIGALSAELGPDLDRKRDEKGSAGRYAEAGGRFVVNTIIPFRGLVREISGAAASERRLERAKEAGVARRGYLRGLQAAKGCAVED